MELSKNAEDSLIEKLKQQLGDISTGKFTRFDFLRWLQGHDFNVDIVAPKLRHHLKVLQSYEFDSYEPHHIFENYWPYNVLGNSGKNNTIAILMCMGNLDGQGITKSASATESTKTLIHNMERLLDDFRNVERQTGEQSGLLLILDFQGVVIDENWFWLAKSPGRILLAAYTLHYAEFMQKTVCINCPSLFYYIYQIAKTVLPERTCKKITVLGSNWRTEILNYIDSAKLPLSKDTNLGHHWEPKIKKPKKVENQFYWKPNENEPTKDQLKTFVVNAWKSDYLTVYASSVGSILEFYFHTNKDFGFGVFFTKIESENNAENMEMVYPYMGRMLGTTVPINDKIVCNKIGYYKLKFNNEFSWVHKLKVWYRIVWKSVEE